jgi:hypothetical protein
MVDECEVESITLKCMKADGVECLRSGIFSEDKKWMADVWIEALEDSTTVSDAIEACHNLCSHIEEHEDDGDECGDYLRDMFYDARYEYFEGDESVGFHFGMWPDDINDNETGAQFRKRVEEHVEKFLGRKEDCSWICEGWYPC